MSRADSKGGYAGAAQGGSHLPCRFRIAQAADALNAWAAKIGRVTATPPQSGGWSARLQKCVDEQSKLLKA
jgi:hypothetical protein